MRVLYILLITLLMSSVAFADYQSYWGFLSKISGADLDVGVKVFFPDNTAIYAKVKRKIADDFTVAAGYMHFTNSTYYDNLTFIEADHRIHYDYERELLLKGKYDFLHINFKDVSYTGTIFRTKFSLTKQQGNFFHFMGVQIPLYVNTSDDSFTMKGESVESFGYIGSSYKIFDPISVTAMVKKDILYYGLSMNLSPLPVYLLFNQDEHGAQQVSFGTEISGF